MVPAQSQQRIQHGFPGHEDREEVARRVAVHRAGGMAEAQLREMTMHTRLRWATLLAALVVAPTATAHAQFGGLIKKAKQTITRDTTTPKPDPVKTDRASAVPVVPGSAITDAPVTSDRLDAM